MTDNSLDKALGGILQRHRNTYGRQTLMTPAEIDADTLQAIEKAFEEHVIAATYNHPPDGVDKTCAHLINEAMRTLLYGEKG